MGFAGSDVQAHLFFADRSAKVSSVTVEVTTKNEGTARDRACDSGCADRR